MLRIRQVRVEHKETQAEVAEAVGCSSVVFSRYENGQRQPPIEILISIARHFNVSVDYLVGNSEYTVPPLPVSETNLLRAWRCADKRAQQDAMEILAKYTK